MLVGQWADLHVFYSPKLTEVRRVYAGTKIAFMIDNKARRKILPMEKPRNSMSKAICGIANAHCHIARAQRISIERPAPIWAHL